MNSMMLLSPPDCRPVMGALRVASLIPAGGCTQIPSLSEPPAGKPVEQLGSAMAVSAPYSTVGVSRIRSDWHDGALARARLLVD